MEPCNAFHCILKTSYIIEAEYFRCDGGANDTLINDIKLEKYSLSCRIINNPSSWISVYTSDGSAEDYPLFLLKKVGKNLSARHYQGAFHKTELMCSTIRYGTGYLRNKTNLLTFATCTLVMSKEIEWLP